MSFGQGDCNPNEAMDEFYGGINAHWPVMERVSITQTAIEAYLVRANLY